MVMPCAPTPPSPSKYSVHTCSKLTITFSCETTTADGARVEPEVYCSTAVLGRDLVGWKSTSVSRARASTSMTADVRPGSRRAHATTWSTALEVVRIATGEL